MMQGAFYTCHRQRDTGLGKERIFGRFAKVSAQGLQFWCKCLDYSFSKVFQERGRKFCLEFIILPS